MSSVLKPLLPTLTCLSGVLAASSAVFGGVPVHLTMDLGSGPVQNATIPANSASDFELIAQGQGGGWVGIVASVRAVPAGDLPPTPAQTAYLDALYLARDWLAPKSASIHGVQLPATVASWSEPVVVELATVDDLLNQARTLGYGATSCMQPILVDAQPQPLARTWDVLCDAWLASTPGGINEPRRWLHGLRPSSGAVSDRFDAERIGHSVVKDTQGLTAFNDFYHGSGTWSRADLRSNAIELQVVMQPVMLVETTPTGATTDVGTDDIVDIDIRSLILGAGTEITITLSVGSANPLPGGVNANLAGVFNLPPEIEVRPGGTFLLLPVTDLVGPMTVTVGLAKGIQHSLPAIAVDVQMVEVDLTGLVKGGDKIHIVSVENDVGITTNFFSGLPVFVVP